MLAFAKRPHGEDLRLLRTAATAPFKGWAFGEFNSRFQDSPLRLRTFRSSKVVRTVLCADPQNPSA